MAENVTTDIAEIGIRFLDDAHVAWVAAESESAEALRAWFEDPRHDRAYYAYVAALDREEAAALDLAKLAQAAQPCHDALGDD